MNNDNNSTPLSDEEVVEKLKSLPAWEFIHDKISKTFLFPSFVDGIKFVAKLAPFCDGIDHHPDIYIHYKKITFDLQTLSAGDKVTEKDIVVARKIEELFK